MIKFFRRIRQNLIVEGNLKRYLFYSIGEILLIVIGILLAVQINIRNENSKQRVEEIKALKEIRENLTASVAILARNIDGTSRSLHSMRVMIDHLSNDKPYNDTLNRHLQFMWFAPPSFPRSGIETLKSKGFGLISNDSVRIKVISYYEVEESAFMANAYDAEFMRFKNYMINEFIDYFSFRSNELGDDITGLVPINYQELINNDRMENLIRDWHSHRKYMNSFRQSMKGTIKQLIETISKEIDRIE